MKILKIISILFFSIEAMACDVCNINAGLSPDDFKNSISFNYRYRYLMGQYDMVGYITSPSRHAAHYGEYHYGKKVDELFHVFELRGNYYFGNNMRLTASIPFVMNERFFNNVREQTISGIGDPIFMMNYQLVDKRNPANDSWGFSHRLFAGGGVKLPIGKSNLRAEDNELIDIDFQPGSGSLDFLINLDYLLRVKNIGATFNANYMLKGHSKIHDYQYGNSLNNALNLFFIMKIGNFKFIPAIGYYMEIFAKDKSMGIIENATGGHIIMGNLEGSIYFKDRLKIFAKYQPSIKNNLNGNSQLPTLNRFVTGVTYNFN